VGFPNEYVVRHEHQSRAPDYNDDDRGLPDQHVSEHDDRHWRTNDDVNGYHTRSSHVPFNCSGRAHVGEHFDDLWRAHVGLHINVIRRANVHNIYYHARCAHFDVR
jgi:hypothetical protein